MSVSGLSGSENSSQKRIISYHSYTTSNRFSPSCHCGWLSVKPDYLMYLSPFDRIYSIPERCVYLANKMKTKMLLNASPVHLFSNSKCREALLLSMELEGCLFFFFYRLSHFIAWRSNFLSKAKENIINHHHYFAGLQIGTFGVWSLSVWSSCATPATTYYLTKWYAVKVSPHSQCLASVWLAPSINIYSKYLNALKVHYAVLRKGIQTQNGNIHYIWEGYNEGPNFVC